jgi:hypothetical protein
LTQGVDGSKSGGKRHDLLRGKTYYVYVYYKVLIPGPGGVQEQARITTSYTLTVPD